GPKHLAVALGVPTLTIHGSSDPAAWTPPHPAHAAVRRDELDCVGCRLNRCPRELECLRELPVERVLEAALALRERTAP
ncbi:MAG: glycosyltransferase family 9 protein, partial [Elusimicrobia bacterium]|nr:glycosyltransferase family 9 protein [Elusimicrobiota bacterium]